MRSRAGQARGLCCVEARLRASLLHRSSTSYLFTQFHHSNLRSSSVVLRRSISFETQGNLPKVVVTRQLPEEALEAIQNNCHIIDYWDVAEEAMPRQRLLNSVKNAKGLYCLLTDKVDRELLQHAPNLKVVSSMSVGVDHIDVKACKERGVVIGHTPGVLTDSTADLAVALVFATARKILPGVAAVKDGSWRTWSPFWMAAPFDVTGCTIGIVGLGRIGAAFGERMWKGFNCNLLYFNPKPKPELANPINAQPVGIDQLLNESDIVSVHCPLTDSTRKMFNDKLFAQMKRTAIFINTSRGGVVDQDALYRALKNQTIAAAGLDVTDPEPLPTTSPLLTLPNIVVLPHIASATVPTRTKMVMMAVHNLVAGAHDRKLPFGLPM